MDRVFALCGPTASGKSEIGLTIAESSGFEIVACDAIQVYRGMDIGTAKASAAERERVPHHCLDLVEPVDEFSVADYQRAAREAIAAVHARGRIPLMVGGTGLYLRAAVDDLSFDGPPDPARRAALEATDLERLVGELERLDPARAQRTDLNNPRRVVRAIEIAQEIGPGRDTDPAWLERSSIYNLTLVVITPETRAELYERINTRVDRMLDAGWLEEVERLQGGPRPMSRSAAAAIGYAELASVLHGDRSLEDAAEATKARTRAYARRQLTWFRREPRAQWIEGSPESATEAVAAILEEARE